MEPLATNTYTVRYGHEQAAARPDATDLNVASGTGQVEITTKQFGARLSLGEETYAEPVTASQVPGDIEVSPSR